MSPSTDPVATLLHPLLADSLSNEVCDVNLSTLSRVSAERIEELAIRHIGRVELVDSHAFASDYGPLYAANFHGHEAERTELIVQRLADESAGRRKGLAPYHLIGIRGVDGAAIGGAQFSVLLLRPENVVVPYLQYIYVRKENRGQLLSELLHTLVLAVSLADARKTGWPTPQVPFTLCETELDPTQSAAVARSTIHSRSGSQALMLREKGDGRLWSAHIQPGLTPEDPPTTMIWLLRACPGREVGECDDRLGRALITAYFRTFRDDGYPERNIVRAEEMMEERYKRDCEFCQIPLSTVTPDMCLEA